MTQRSSRHEVRNPIAGDPKVAEIIGTLTPEARAALAVVLTRLAHSWRDKANYAWRNHKPPMAAYWKSNAVNARHLALALRTTTHIHGNKLP